MALFGTSQCRSLFAATESIYVLKSSRAIDFGSPGDHFDCFRHPLYGFFEVTRLGIGGQRIENAVIPISRSHAFVANSMASSVPSVQIREVMRASDTVIPGESLRIDFRAFHIRQPCRIVAAQAGGPAEYAGILGSYSNGLTETAFALRFHDFAITKGD